MWREVPAPKDFDRPAEPKSRRAPAWNCPGCGRFARHLATTPYYNGTWNCVRTEVQCGQCGRQRIEHV